VENVLIASSDRLTNMVVNVDRTPRSGGDDRPGQKPADELRVFLESALPRFRSRWGGDTGFEARLAWQQILAEGRWVAPGWPAEYGVRGLGPADQNACEEVMATSHAPMIAGMLGVKNVG